MQSLLLPLWITKHTTRSAALRLTIHSGASLPSGWWRRRSASALRYPSDLAGARDPDNDGLPHPKTLNLICLKI
jgi:hypothetical protein